MSKDNIDIIADQALKDFPECNGAKFRALTEHTVATTLNRMFPKVTIDELEVGSWYITPWDRFPIFIKITSKEPHLVCMNGPFIRNYLRDRNQIFYGPINLPDGCTPPEYC